MGRYNRKRSRPSTQPPQEKSSRSPLPAPPAREEPLSSGVQVRLSGVWTPPEEGAPTITEMKLWNRSARERWPVPEAKRAAIMERLFAVIEDAESTRREVLTAMRTLASFDQLNLEQARLDKSKNQVKFELLSDGERVATALEMLQRARERRALEEEADPPLLPLPSPPRRESEERRREP